MKTMVLVLASCLVSAPIAAAQAESNPSSEAPGWLADDDLTTLTLRSDTAVADVHQYRSFSVAAFQDGADCARCRRARGRSSGRD